MKTPSRIALVTGGNRGIGLEICRELAALDYHVILASRDLAKGTQAAESLHGRVTPCALDVTNADSIQQIHAFVQQEFGRLDVLVNNAAIYLDKGVSVLQVKVDTLKTTLETNLYGPLLLSQAFIPLMQVNNYGRIVNISSDVAIIENLAGWSTAYRLSKVGLNALTRMLAAEVSGINIKINSMSPGWVKTDMGGSGAPRSVEQGADTAVWLATLPDDGPTNGFFRDRKPIAW